MLALSSVLRGLCFIYLFDSLFPLLSHSQIPSPWGTLIALCTPSFPGDTEQEMMAASCWTALVIRAHKVPVVVCLFQDLDSGLALPSFEAGNGDAKYLWCL